MSNYNSIRPRRGVEGWQSGSHACTYAGFAYSYGIKLELKRCNSPSQEISSLLEKFIAVEVSLFRTGQKRLVCFGWMCLCSYFKKCLHLNWPSAGCCEEQNVREGPLYICKVIHHADVFVIWFWKKLAQMKKKMFPILNLIILSVNSLLIQLACCKSGRDFLDKTPHEF